MAEEEYKLCCRAIANIYKFLDLNKNGHLTLLVFAKTQNTTPFDNGHHGHLYETVNKIAFQAIPSTFHLCY